MWKFVNIRNGRLIVNTAKEEEEATILIMLAIGTIILLTCQILYV